MSFCGNKIDKFPQDEKTVLHFLALIAEKEAIMTGNAFLIFNESTY